MMTPKVRPSLEALERRAGWKEYPNCRYVTVAPNELRCGYDYDMLLSAASRELNDEILEDLGLSNSFEEAVENGVLTKRCSVRDCPLLLRKD